MRRILVAIGGALAALAVAALPAAAHDPAGAARLGAGVQAGLAAAGVEPWSVPRGPVRAAALPRTVRIVVIPLRLEGGKLLGQAELDALVPSLDAWWSAATGGALRARGSVAPVVDLRPIPAPINPSGEADGAALERAVRMTAARGVRLAGAIPLFIAASDEPSPTSWGGVGLGAVMNGGMWSGTEWLAHEVGHALGLSHASTPDCADPRRTAECDLTNGPEYGDVFDAMGSGGDAYGAFPLVALGLVAPDEMRPGAAATVAAVPPLGPGATGGRALRARTWTDDVLVESRATARRAGAFLIDAGVPTYIPGDALELVPGAVLVGRVEPRYRDDVFPKTYRLPRPVVCAEPCYEPELALRPGDELALPGTLRLRVLPPAGAVPQVETTWLDRSPLVVGVAGVVERPWGATSATAALLVSAAGGGAGVRSVEVRIGRRTKVLAGPTLPEGLAVPSPDPITERVPSATGRRRVLVRVPAPWTAKTARVVIVDAAGNRSVARTARLSRRRVPAIGWAPSALAAAGELEPVRLPRRALVTVRIATDPALARLGYRASLFLYRGSSSRPFRQIDVPLGRDGRATLRTRIPAGSPAVRSVNVTVPVLGRGGRVGFVFAQRTLRSGQ